MGSIEQAIFTTIAWIPVVALLSAITFLGIGFFLKCKAKSGKKFNIIGIVCLAIFIAYCIILIIIGMIGLGPGMLE